MTILNNKGRLREVRKELRNNCTEAERILWFHLKGTKCNGIKFRRQHSIGRYIIDFYSTKYKIGIELDGKIHEKREEYDQIRTEYLNACGIKIIRFTNEEVIYNLNLTLKKIKCIIPPPY